MSFSHPKPSNLHLQSGFTLVELMVTVSITAVLLSVALPDFLKATRGIQLSQQAKEMESAIKFTRAKAMQLGQVVVMCRANAALDKCLTSGSPEWQGGWLIHNNLPDADGALNNQYDAATETLYAIKQPMSAGISVLAPDGVGNRIIFNAAGDSAGPLANVQSLTFSYADDSSVDNQRFLAINRAGRTRISTWADCQNGLPC